MIRFINLQNSICTWQNYFQSGLTGDSELTVEWTAQHGCGGDEDTSPHKLNCNMVLQFMCQDDDEDTAARELFTCYLQIVNAALQISVVLGFYFDTNICLFCIALYVLIVKTFLNRNNLTV